MTNTWHTYQTRLAASLNHWLTPAPRWLLVRGAAFAALEPPSSMAQDNDESVMPLVRLPGIWRPESGPLQVHRQ
jgi:hypothetical protein